MNPTDSAELPRDATLLRIFIGDGDRHDGRPLYEAIVLKAREHQLAGAKKSDGLWPHEPPAHGEDSPTLDRPAHRHRNRGPSGEINAFLPVLDGMMDGGLVPPEKVLVVHYRSHAEKAP